MSKIVCFLHSCTLDFRGTEILEYLIKYLNSKGFLNIVENIFVNNVGKHIDPNMFSRINSKIRITNYSADASLFENCTLRQMHFFAQLNPEYKILYLHTKGASRPINHWAVPGTNDWNDFMLYCLVDHHIECVRILDHVQAVGCDYRPMLKDPTHFSGNFWWACANYIAKLSIYELAQKADAEWWLFKGNPTFINIHNCPYGHYENRYRLQQYAQLVDASIQKNLYNLEHPHEVKILYGLPEKYIDVTDICMRTLVTDGVLRLPVGDETRNELFTDPICGKRKHLLIGEMVCNYEYDYTLPL